MRSIVRTNRGMSSLRQAFLDRVRTFCEAHAITAPEFGRRAVGDRDFVRDVENGRPVVFSRIERAERFMADNASETKTGSGKVSRKAAQPGRAARMAISRGAISQQRGKVAAASRVSVRAAG
jgi:hypothetical protein